MDQSDHSFEEFRDQRSRGCFFIILALMLSLTLTTVQTLTLTITLTPTITLLEIPVMSYMVTHVMFLMVIPMMSYMVTHVMFLMVIPMMSYMVTHVMFLMVIPMMSYMVTHVMFLMVIAMMSYMVTHVIFLMVIPMMSYMVTSTLLMEPEFCYGNDSCVRTVYPVTVRTALYVVLGSAVVLTMLGNLFVIVAIAHFKQLHTPPNYLTLSLAVTDLLLGVLVMFPGMIESVENCWYFGEMYCKLYNTSAVLLCNASILNLSFISIDRYYAVCHPMLYPLKITVHTAVVMILVTWCVSAVVGFGMFFKKLNISGIEMHNNNVVCEGRCFLIQTLMTSTVSSTFSFYLPGVIMLGIYLKIFMVAQRQVRTIGLQNTSAFKVDKHQRKATKTLAFIMGVFLSFWMPFFICNIIDPLIGYSIPPAMFDSLKWLGFLNSTINPFVYAFFYSWFRKAFQIIISGRIFRSDMSDTKLFAE
ncbi:trace amine-associated receptor 1-like [Gadus morhua]|uniref:trace amine-associated receptor 1-like n=1 Tax=Gadus morhua TaxID=8049 RepID=UPI0011B7488F|nr:trace amine-associated receptor 1-like [Gadus morhua]